ncbi:unnamed protein product [Dovyalis caffra]|uniref:Uncharacterized protein n=1 Tax=Dovyalis caffra TaxID=77055 RepID=A0AAV1QXU5_9ROSI|nr:unnamed protein product [Dovyalis caffra]
MASPRASYSFGLHALAWVPRAKLGKSGTFAMTRKKSDKMINMKQQNYLIKMTQCDTSQDKLDQLQTSK